MDRSEFILRVAHAIIRAPNGRLSNYSYGGYAPGNDAVLISSVYAEFSSQSNGPLLTVSEFKSRIVTEAKEGTLRLKMPAIAVDQFYLPGTDRADIVRSKVVFDVGGKYGRSEWIALDPRQAEKIIAAHRGDLDALDLTAKRGLPKAFFRTKDPIEPPPVVKPSPVVVPPIDGPRFPSITPPPPPPPVEPIRPEPKDNPKVPPPIIAGDIVLPLTANDALMDAMIRQQVYLLRLSDTLQNDIVKLLNKTELDIAAKIRATMTTPGISPLTLKRLETLKDFIANTRGRSWAEVNSTWLTRLKEIANKQPELLSGMFQTVSPVQLDLLLPAPELIKAIVEGTPFEGKVLKDWAASLKRSELSKIEDQIKIGMVQGEGPEQLARRVVGSFELGGVDGVTEVTRRNARAITRTAVNAIMNMVNREFFNNNADLFQGERYVATLDSRTTPICRSLDGKVFPVGEGPIPPLHWNCRSIRVPTLDGEALGKRPARNFTEKGLLREFTSDEGLDPVTERDALPRGYKGAFDKFMQKRVRELTGQVAADVNYNDWLSRQPPAFQDDILGKTKGQLFRTGKLSLDKFVDGQYNELSLSELARLHADIFRAAGLNPEDFL